MIHTCYESRPFFNRPPPGPVAALCFPFVPDWAYTSSPNPAILPPVVEEVGVVSTWQSMLALAGWHGDGSCVTRSPLDG